MSGRRSGRSEDLEPVSLGDWGEPRDVGGTLGWRWEDSFKRRLADLAGSDRLRFTGRVRGGKLKPGPYQLRAVARNSAGKSGAPVTKSFRIIR